MWYVTFRNGLFKLCMVEDKLEQNFSASENLSCRSDVFPLRHSTLPRFVPYFWTRPGLSWPPFDESTILNMDNHSWLVISDYWRINEVRLWCHFWAIRRASNSKKKYRFYVLNWLKNGIKLHDFISSPGFNHELTYEAGPITFLVYNTISFIIG